MQLGARLTDRTPTGIATTIGDLVSSGELPVGTRLPTVRALARELGVSPSTVSEAWRQLRRHGVITTDRRRGTTVRARASVSGRYWRVPVDPGTFALDLSTGTPDPALLPELAPVLASIDVDLPVTSYLDAPVLPALDGELRRRWPFTPEVLTVVDGAQDALDRLVGALVRFGDAVVVEDPCFPPLLDLLDLAGARVLGVPVDAEGIEPGPLAVALDHRPVAVFVQPRAHNPTGASLSAGRAGELARLLAGHDLVVVEDDHSGAIAGVELASLGRALPDRVVHIHSFSKSHGPDLRLAALGGATAPIEAVIRRRRLGPSWSSRLLQSVLAAMLTDAGTEARVAKAAATYARRRSGLRAELAARGVDTIDGSGLNLWIPVHDEQVAVVALAAHGIGVSPGSPFEVDPAPTPHVRVTVGAVRDGFGELADRLAQAAAQPGADAARLSPA